jgi:hypothetical protein
MCKHLLATIAIVVSANTARSDKPVPPYSHTTTSADGRFIFVMISPLPPEAELKPWNEEWQARIRFIRQTWPRSGMYRHDGLKEPLWTVDWYSLSVLVASDGVHVVRLGPWAGKGDFHEEAVSFFANGRLVKTYAVRDLVRSPDQLPTSVSHYEWEETVRLDDATKTLRVDTRGGEHFTFDVRTGEVIERSADWPFWLQAGLALAGTVVGLGLLWLVIRRLTLTRPAQVVALESPPPGPTTES